MLLSISAADAPNVADWLSAWGQIGGAIATFIAVLVALGIARRDGQRIERDRMEEARGRAAMVYAWDSGGDVVVANHSDRPVRDVRVSVEHHPEMNLAWSPNNMNGKAADLLPAGDTATVRGSYALYYGENSVQLLDAAPKQSWIVLEFFDTEGHHWRRRASGQPVLVHDAQGQPATWRVGRLSLTWHRHLKQEPEP